MRHQVRLTLGDLLDKARCRHHHRRHQEAQAVGWQREYPKVQILTIEELLTGQQPEMPPMRQTFQRSERIAKPGHQQPAMASLFEDAYPPQHPDTPPSGT